jgi:hypothetical protein
VTGNRVPAPAFGIRWRIFSRLPSVAMIIYFQQRSVTVAAGRIMPGLPISQMWAAWLASAALLVSALDAGICADRVVHA